MVLHSSRPLYSSLRHCSLEESRCLWSRSRCVSPPSHSRLRRIDSMVRHSDGKKMSKSLKNFPDPNLIIDAYGADALRLFLINSPVVRGESLRFREDGVKEVISRVLLPFLNSFRFFLAQTALLKKETGRDFMYDPLAPLSSNVMDQWILARCQSLIQFVGEEMKGSSPVSRFCVASLTMVYSLPIVHRHGSNARVDR